MNLENGEPRIIFRIYDPPCIVLAMKVITCLADSPFYTPDQPVYLSRQSTNTRQVNCVRVVRWIQGTVRKTRHFRVVLGGHRVKLFCDHHTP